MDVIVRQAARVHAALVGPPLRRPRMARPDRLRRRETGSEGRSATGGCARPDSRRTASRLERLVPLRKDTRCITIDAPFLSDVGCALDKNGAERVGRPRRCGVPAAISNERAPARRRSSELRRSIKDRHRSHRQSYPYRWFVADSGSGMLSYLQTVAASQLVTQSMHTAHVRKRALLGGQLRNCYDSEYWNDRIVDVRLRALEAR